MLERKIAALQENRITSLLKNHDRCMTTVDKAMKTARDTLDTTQRQVEEARKLKQEIQETYDKIRELRGLPFRGIV